MLVEPRAKEATRFQQFLSFPPRTSIQHANTETSTATATENWTANGTAIGTVNETANPTRLARNSANRPEQSAEQSRNFNSKLKLSSPFRARPSKQQSQIH